MGMTKVNLPPQSQEQASTLPKVPAAIYRVMCFHLKGGYPSTAGEDGAPGAGERRFGAVWYPNVVLLIVVDSHRL